MASARLSNERGFSLIEMMVSVLIIALLISIAIPIFLGLTSRAQDTGAKTSAALALRIAKASVGEQGDYSDTSPASLAASEPTLSFVAGGTSSTSKTIVSTGVPDPSLHVAAVYSESGKCFFAQDHVNGRSEFGVLDPATTADCRADNAAAVTFASVW